MTHPGDTADNAATPQPTSEADLSILTFIGADRTGVIDELSHAVSGLGCHIDKIRVATLAGWATVLMSVSGESTARQTLQSTLAEIAGRLEMEVRFATPKPTFNDDNNTRFDLRLSQPSERVSAVDDAEAMTQVSNLLRVMNVNIADIEHEKPGRDFNFAFTFVVDVPRDVPLGHMRELLAQLTGGIGVDFELGERSMQAEAATSMQA